MSAVAFSVSITVASVLAGSLHNATAFRSALVDLLKPRRLGGKVTRRESHQPVSPLSSAGADVTSCAPWFTLGAAAPFDALISGLPRGTWENFKDTGASRQSLCTSNSGIILRQNVGHFTPRFSENCVFPHCCCC